MASEEAGREARRKSQRGGVNLFEAQTEAVKDSAGREIARRLTEKDFGRTGTARAMSKKLANIGAKLHDVIGEITRRDRVVPVTDVTVKGDPV